ncbi:hypothetical protein DL96DRAFT_942644 [Flagelloscypha sp. PMI_526]|nr:hypothetical protein DL96DRAFT_942644 [Flagelloscypha sp. PMI_526]
MALPSKSLFDRRSAPRLLTINQLAVDTFRTHPPSTNGSLPLPTIVSSPICSPSQTPTADPDGPFTTAPSSPTTCEPEPTKLPHWIATPPTPADPRARRTIQRSITTVNRKRQFPSSSTFPAANLSDSHTLRHFHSEPVLTQSFDLVADVPGIRDGPWNKFALAHPALHRYTSSANSQLQSQTNSSEGHDSHALLRVSPANDDLRTYHAAMEIFTTELGYLADLEAFVTIYLANLPPLIARQVPHRQLAGFSSLSRGSANSVPSSPVTAEGESVISPTKEKEPSAQLLLSNREADCLRRNADELLDFHRDFVRKLQAIASSLCISLPDDDPTWDESIDVNAIVEALAHLFTTEAPKFTIYERFCARHQESLDIVRRLQNQHRLEWDLFERQSASKVFELLGLFHKGSPSTKSSTKSHRRRSHSVASLDAFPSIHETTELPRRVSRLTFLDYMIKPIQRICKYPLLLDQLRRKGTASYFVVENAALAMRHVASSVDEARHRQDIAVQTSAILSRISVALPMPRTSHIQPMNRELRQLTPSFVSSLGSCLMSGPLDVYKPVNSLQVTIKAKYFGAFLYLGGYLILAKVTKKVYDPKFWFKIDDVASDDKIALPNAVRITSGGFQLELAASCLAERDVWFSALQESLKPQEIEWINEPIPSYKLNERPTTPSDNIDDPMEALVLTSPPLSKAVEYPALTEELLAAFEADTKHKRKPELPVRSDSRGPSRRSSTVSVKALFTPMTSDSTTIVVQRASAAVRLHADNGLHDVISEPLQNARLLASRDEDHGHFQRPSSVSGSAQSTKSSRSRIYRTSETVRIPRSRSLVETDTSHPPSEPRRIPANLRITPAVEASSISSSGPTTATTITPTATSFISPVSQGSSDSASSQSVPSEDDSQKSGSREQTARSSSKSIIRNMRAIFGREPKARVLTASASVNTVKSTDHPQISRKNTMLRRLIA